MKMHKLLEEEIILTGRRGERRKFEGRKGKEEPRRKSSKKLWRRMMILMDDGEGKLLC